MILETSALVAILREEDRAPHLAALLNGSPRVVVPAHVPVEAGMVLGGQRGDEGVALVRAFLATVGAEVLPFTEAHARAAQDAFLRWGKGRHPAGLNFGDCMSYAVAKVERLPLLFVGEDFSRTDVQAA